MTLAFNTANADDIQGVRTPKTSKYNDLVEACMTLTPGNGIQVPYTEEDDPSKMRINIANAVRNRVMGAWQAQGFNFRLRVVRGDGYIGIVCNDALTEEPETTTTKKKSSKKTSK